LDPRTVFTGIAQDNEAAAAEFARQRTVRRYNQQLNQLIQFWAKLLHSGGDALRALDVTNGVDAVFRLSTATAFSRRCHA
jgi:hypothetical protein